MVHWARLTEWPLPRIFGVALQLALTNFNVCQLNLTNLQI